MVADARAAPPAAEQRCKEKQRRIRAETRIGRTVCEMKVADHSRRRWCRPPRKPHAERLDSADRRNPLAAAGHRFPTRCWPSYSRIIPARGSARSSAATRSWTTKSMPPHRPRRTEHESSADAEVPLSRR